MLTIDITTARRFVLGKQGLWPGRRWHGLEGLAQAMTALEYLQLDPLQVVARSQDIALHSRVLDSAPGDWEEVTYRQRRFFDWGGWLAVRPMEELPHWRTVMQRERDGHPDCDARIRDQAHELADTINEMRAVLRQRGVVSNRDFDMATRARTQSYRGRKDSAVALYYLWRTGEVMTHHRENFERIYALAESMAPPHLLYTSDDETADRFLIRKEVSFAGIARLNRTADAFHRGVPFSQAQRITAALLADGELAEVRVEGWKPIHYVLAADLPLLEDLGAGRIPAAWTPLGPTTTDEVLLLAPLDPVSARGRAQTLFGFDYVWEVYKPEHARRFGYYTLPILWGDQLVARCDLRLDRAAGALVLLGLWLEDSRLGEDEAFAEALAAGCVRFARFVRARALDASAVAEPLLRRCLQARQAMLGAG